MTEPPDPMEEDDALAAEHALGLDRGAERAATAGRRLADPAFARAVEAWEHRLAGLAEEAAPISPPEGLWTRIADHLPTEGSDASVVVTLRRRVTAWRGATLAAAGIAACLAVALAVGVRSSSPAPMMTARLSASAQGPAVFIALYDPSRRALVLTPAEVTTAAGRSPELWLIPPGGKPVALGVATFGSSVQLVSSQGAKGLAAGELAVSLEPEGGSPTGQPTGPVIATGQLSRL